jgi:hypothetical protein
MATVTAEQAFARYEMFTEAADHLDGAVTLDGTEQAEIPFVQALIRRNASKWLDRAHSLTPAPATQTTTQKE